MSGHDEPTLFDDEFEPVLDGYRGEAPHIGYGTSEESASKVDRTIGQSKVWDALAFGSPARHGLTCGEIEDATGLTHQSASARLREMSQDDEAPLWIVGHRKYAGTGRTQRVYMTRRNAIAHGRTRLRPETKTSEPASHTCPHCGHTWKDIHR